MLKVINDEKEYTWALKSIISLAGLTVKYPQHFFFNFDVSDVDIRHLSRLYT